MDIQKIINQLKELKEISETDEEMAHIEADNILVEILKYYQLTEIIDVYKSIHKYY